LGSGAGVEGGGGDVSDDLESLLARVIHPQHLLPPQRLVSALLHHSLRVSSGVEAGQQFSVDEGLGVVDHEEHDNLGDQVSAGLGDNLHVGIHQISDRLHLSLELWIH